MMQRDIRKWFMKPHDTGSDAEANLTEPKKKNSSPESQRGASEVGDQTISGRRKTSKYFAKDKLTGDDRNEVKEAQNKRKQQPDERQTVKPRSARKLPDDDSSDNDEKTTVKPKRKGSSDVTPGKRLKTGSGRGVAPKPVVNDETDEDVEISIKSGGRGRGGKGRSATPARGRGRGGGGRGGLMTYGERKDPPHKGEKEIPEGAADCLDGLTFVISGTLDSLEREEAEDLIKRHGGRVTSAVSKKTSYLLCDEDVEGRKSSKAKELCTPFLSEDALFAMISSSKPATVKKSEESSLRVPSVDLQRKNLPKTESDVVKRSSSKTTHTPSSGGLPVKKANNLSSEQLALLWTEKYRPKVPNDIIGNQSVVNQIHNWLKNWEEQVAGVSKRGKGKKQNDPATKKALLLSGPPGIGKTTSAKLVSQMLGFQIIEVNASDNRGKADNKISKGISGSNANCVKELVSNESIGVDMDRSKNLKTVLIMDEVDGMSAGDRGGIADLIDSIKLSKIPIICICNDRYSQKLKSLLNHCLLLSFRRPTKQQMAKRLMQIANAEGLQIKEIALEELAERLNGDMRMAVNQLHYMSLSMSVIEYDDVKKRLLNSAKDEDISPFTAVDKLFGFNGGKLRMDERIDLSMSDLDLVPLLVQENYVNYHPSSVGKDENGLTRMRLLARAAESIADGDIINVQIRRYRQWQLSQNAAFASCITPAALLHGRREILEPGERNFNRFGGWLGKNSTAGKNTRLLEDLHYHLLASRHSDIERQTLRLDYLTLLLKRLTDPLRLLPKDEAVEEVVEFMNVYSISQEDFDTIVELSKFKGHSNPLDGIPAAVKAALTRAYKENIKTSAVRAADLITLPGVKKAPKKRVAAMLESPTADLEEGKDELPPESEDEGNSDVDDDIDKGAKLESEIQSLKSKGIRVETKLQDVANSGGKKKTAGRAKSGAASEQKPSARGRGGSAAKRKR